MPHHYGHLHQQCTINPKLSYPLLASSLTDRQIESIHKIIHPSVIAAKGFNWNWHIPLRYGKHKYCGLEMLDLKVEQRLRKIQLMRKHFLNKRHKIPIQSIIEWYQLTAGVEEQLLEKSNKHINSTSSVWFQDIIDFLYKHNISIFTKKILNIKSQRKYDKCIMGEVLQLQLSKTLLIQLNSCRIYLHVFHLSDMIEPSGKQFRTEYITGTKSTKQTSSYRWPNQMKPSPTAWKLWRKTIKDIFTLTLNYTLPIELYLSNWIVPLNERQMKHQW